MDEDNYLSEYEVKRRIGTAFWEDFQTFMKGKTVPVSDGREFYFSWDVGDFIRIVKVSLR